MPTLVAALGNASRMRCWSSGVTGAPPNPMLVTELTSVVASAGQSRTRGPIEPIAAQLVTRSRSMRRSTSSGSNRPERNTSFAPVLMPMSTLANRPDTWNSGEVIRIAI